MSKQNSNHNSKGNSLTQQANKPVAKLESSTDFTAQTELAHNLSLDRKPAAIIGDDAIPIVQRQKMAAQIQRLVGNQYLQRTITKVQSVTSAKPATIQRELLPTDNNPTGLQEAMNVEELLELYSTNQETFEIGPMPLMPRPRYTRDWIRGDGQEAIRSEIRARLEEQSQNGELSRLEGYHVEIDAMAGNASRKEWLHEAVDYRIQNVRLYTDDERGVMVAEIGSEMGTTHAEYNIGAREADTTLTAAERADAETAKTIFAMGMALIVPGFGGVVAGGLARFGVSVTAAMASNLGSAIGEAAKSAGNSVIERAHQSSGRTQFFNSIVDGWEEAARVERRYLRDNETNRTRVPDMVIRDTHEYWLALARNNATIWSTWFQEQWRRYDSQVAAIGPNSNVQPPFGGSIRTNVDIPVRIRMGGSATRLALVHHTVVDHSTLLDSIMGDDSNVHTLYRFTRWIDDDLADLATSRVNNVRTIDSDDVQDLP